MTLGLIVGTRTDARGSRATALVGAGTLVRFMLRRDRVRLLTWTGGFALFILYVTLALPVAYATEEDLEAATAIYAGPAGRLLIGPGYGFEAPNFEQVVANGYGLYLLLLSALMSILLVVRHTRAEEQSGRAELVGAGVVGIHARLTSTLVVALITNLVVAAVVAAVMVVVAGFGAAGSLLFAAGMVATGLAFAGVAVVAAQLTEYSRAATGLAGAVLGVSFALRAAGDVARPGGTALSWTSPLAWAQQTAPFVLDRWWPLVLPLALAVATVAAGIVLSGRRDLGAGLFAVRPGPSRAAPWLGTPLGLALRLQRAGLTAWTAALAVSGLVFGTFADALLDAVDDLPEVFFDLFGAEDVLAGYLAYMALYFALFISAYAILAVQAQRTEETSGRGEPVLATAVSRATWMGANLAVSVGGIVGMSIVTGAATGVGAAVVTGDGSYLWELTAAQVNQIPAVLVALGFAVLLFGAAPRAIPAAWAIIIYGFLTETFGELVELPRLARDLSLYGHLAQLPVESFRLAPVATLSAVAAATASAGVAAFRHRDVTAA